MALPTLRSAHLLCLTVALAVPLARAQVFVVGEKSATAGIATDFTPTDLALPDGKLNERGRRELVRMLEAEQGFAHRALPVSPNIVLRANGPLSPGPEQFKRMIYEKGESVAPGDRVLITAMQVKADRIEFDLNGGPYARHRFLSHVQLNGNNMAQPNPERATGSRVTLLFEGQIPEISAPEVKALLAPVIDFGAKSGEQAYAETLPPFLKEAIAEHTVLVGMTHRMVLAAMGAPESKVREHAGENGTGAHYEEWIYGHVPETVQFVRFSGDRVSLIKTAPLGKPVEVRDHDEMNGFRNPVPTREVAMGDTPATADAADGKAGAPPTLRKPGEDLPTMGAGRTDKVQLPPARPDADPVPPAGSPAPPVEAPVPLAGAGAPTS